MDAELLRAVKEMRDSMDYCDDHRPLMERIDAALTATVAEIRKRRAESPWAGPFFAQRGARTGEEGPEWNGMWEVADRQIEWVCERSECDEAETVAAALNAYYGYDAQGNDLLEGMGV